MTILGPDWTIFDFAGLQHTALSAKMAALREQLHPDPTRTPDLRRMLQILRLGHRRAGECGCDNCHAWIQRGQAIEKVLEKISAEVRP